MRASDGSLLLRGARLVGEGDPGAPVDVLVRDGRIAVVARRIDASADRIVEVDGRYLLPGGIDPHVHFQTPSDGTHTADSFTTGSRAAAFGGTTTALQFCVQAPGESLIDTVDRWRGQLEASPSYVNIGFHIMITDLDDPVRLDELRGLPERGVTSFKVFMAGENAISSANLFRTMQIAAEIGARVMIHAEDGASIGVMAQQALAAGRREPREHAATRPVPTEAIAVYRAVEYARMTGAEVYFVHLSSAAAIMHVRAARAEGLPVDGETCPQYFVFDESILQGSFEQSAPFLFTPPPRRARDHDEIWRALEDGALSTIASDHGGYCRHEKVTASDFTTVPQGILGIETRLAFLHHFGVLAGRLSLPRLVELTSTASARLFGLEGKGRVAVGADADLVVFDPDAVQTISQATHHSAHDHNPYEGMSVTGQVTHAVVAGALVVDDRELVGEPVSGEVRRRASGHRRRRSGAAPRSERKQ